MIDILVSFSTYMCLFYHAFHQSLNSYVSLYNIIDWFVYLLESVYRMSTFTEVEAMNEDDNGISVDENEDPAGLASPNTLDTSFSIDKSSKRELKKGVFNDKD